jgi:conjugal transfer pilus assembly protein TraW
MQFYKALAATLSVAVSLSAFAQKTSEEQAQRMVKDTQQNANEMAEKYGQGLGKLVPKTHKKNQEGHTTESFIDSQDRAFSEMQERLKREGLLDGVNEDGNAKHIQQQIPENFMANQKQQLDSHVKEFNKNGMLEGFDAESISKKTQQYQDAAKLIGQQSNAGMLASLKEELGLDFADAPNPDFNPNVLVEPDHLKAVFISFNMRNSDIVKMMRLAVEQGAQLFLKGMHPDDFGVHDTIRRLRFIGRDLEINPDVRFKPRYFDEFNIDTAPTILIRNETGVLYASGITNLEWLENKVNRGEESGYLGKYGDTVTVIEKDIRQEFKDRMANMNFEDKTRKVVNNFWTKKTFNHLPPAQKDDEWYIDPTVQAQDDIINPRGDQLARKGQVVNGITKFPVPLTMFVFDPTDTEQLEWVANNHRDAEGQKMLIFSQLDKSKGWKHLDALRTYFSVELYELPREMIQKFKLTHLPVKISTDMQRKLMRVQQFDVSEAKKEEQ